MDIFCLSIASIFTILYFVMMIKGRKYAGLLENIDDKEFQMKELYGVGMAWEYTIKAFSYEGSIAEKIKPDITVFYGEKYSEYYCRIILAQVYTYAHVCMCFFALLAGFVDGASGLVIMVLGVMIGVVLADKYLKQVHEKLEKRAEECLEEFPNMVMKLALMITSGMILREAWLEVTKGTQGELNDLMETSCELMRNGKSDAEAIYMFGISSGSKEIRKFANTLIQGMEKGNAQLAAVLLQQSSELWELRRQHLLQKGETAATKLVVPTTLMFAGLILVIVTSALNGMSI